MEKPVTFSCDNLTLEALFDSSEGSKAVVITHPHPLMGGDMHNPVVGAIQKAYKSKGFSTLRFNFRGTGRSTGRHGEGFDEIQDVYAARDFLKENGMSRIDLSGYSFGAWVNLMSAQGDHGFDQLTLVSPPVDFIKFETIKDVDALQLVLTGEHDEYASPSHVKKSLKMWHKHSRFIEIPNADRFFSYELEHVENALKDQL